MARFRSTGSGRLDAVIERRHQAEVESARLQCLLHVLGWETLDVRPERSSARVSLWAKPANGWRWHRIGGDWLVRDLFSRIGHPVLLPEED